jgi:hypothetical protein
MYPWPLRAGVSDTDELLREVEQKTDSDLGGGDRKASSEREREGQRPASQEERREAESSTGGLRSRLPSLSRPSAPTVLTPRGLGLALVATVAGFLLAGAIPVVGSLLGGVAGLLGIGVAGFLLGTLGKGRYLELALSGAATGAAAFFLDRLLLSVVGGFALPLTLVGGGAGLLAAVLGLYFGRDLRDGLTRGV